MIDIILFSDPVCASSYIGWQRLKTAMKARPEITVKLSWRPFFISPDHPKQGVPLGEWLSLRHGSSEAALEAYRPVAEALLQEGLEIALDEQSLVPNTLDAQRLIHWAGLDGKQTEIAEAVFSAYFTEGRDIGHHETLADIADSCGMDAALILRLLVSDADLDLLMEGHDVAQQIGIKATPTFIVNGQHAVPGAQPVELWIHALDEAAEKLL